MKKVLSKDMQVQSSDQRLSKHVVKVQTKVTITVLVKDMTREVSMAMGKAIY